MRKAKLSTLKPQITTIKPLIGRATGDEKARDKDREANQPWRKWYHTTRWANLRSKIRARDLYTCRMCGCMCAGKGQSAVDHIKSHNGDESLFWDEDNLQLLCKPCHDQHKQKMDKAARLRY